MAELYIVATPIGNLEDITLRALSTLKKVDVIACEDTRHSLKLLNSYEIKKPLVSCFAAQEEKGSAKVLSLLKEGKSVAYISDAGTPCLSDPGAMLVSKAREAGFTVIPIPGPSAFASLLSVAGMVGKSVTFDGFLSPRPGRRKSRVQELLDRKEAFVLYESPYRLLRLLKDIADIDGVRRVVVGRELTKIHEELVDAQAQEVYDHFASRKEILGECAVLVCAIDRKAAKEED